MTRTPNEKSPDDLLRVDDVAREYHIGSKRIRELVRSGELRHLAVGRKVLIPRWVFLEWVRDNLSGNPSAAGVGDDIPNHAHPK